MENKGTFEFTGPVRGDVNADWQGRNVHFREETDIFPNDSHIRIWQNEETDDYSPHWHNALEIIMPVENSYDVDMEGKKYHLTPGQILFIPSGATHALTAPATGKRFIFLFGIGSMARIRGYNSLQSLLGESVYITSERLPGIYDEIHELMRSMVEEYFSGSEYYEFSIYSSLFRALVLIARHRLDTVLTKEANPARKKHFQRFQNALDYIDQHYNTENVSLEDAASHCGFSKYHFSRLFKEYTGYNFYDYLISRRIRSAEILLSDPSLSITEAGFQSGFSSISTFNRSFKKVKGCTPGEYRSLYQARNAYRNSTI